jgi:hypothetical protein
MENSTYELFYFLGELHSLENKFKAQMPDSKKPRELKCEALISN